MDSSMENCCLNKKEDLVTYEKHPEHQKLVRKSF